MDIELEPIGSAGRIGLLALATDLNSEKELRRFLPEDVELFTNRVQFANPLRLENLRAMSADISRAAAGILPGTHVDAFIYGCTSGTIAIGAETVANLVAEGRPGVPVTNPVSAVLAAIRHLDARRISVLTPYPGPVNAELGRFLIGEGVDVISIHGLDFDSDIDITGIPSQALSDAAVEACDDEADVLFISCTALRTAGVIDDVERRIGKPVITSNQALVWHSLKLIGYRRNSPGIGSLLRSRNSEADEVPEDR